MKINFFVFLSLLAVALLPFPAFATSQNFISVETKLAADGTARTSISMILESPPASVQVPLYGVSDFSKVYTEANFKNFACRQVESQSYDLLLDCDVSSITSGTGSFKVEFSTEKFVSGKNPHKFEQHVAVPNIQFARLQVKVVLPEGAGLAGQPLPAFASNATDGRTIYVSWIRESVPPFDLLVAQLTYQTFGDEVDLSAFWVITIVLAVFAGGVFVYRRKLSPQLVLPVLKSDEKAVMEALLKHGGTAHQKLLVRESSYSKAKVSKLLKSLAERGIVKLEKIGRANRVYLSRELNYKKQKSSGNN